MHGLLELMSMLSKQTYFKSEINSRFATLPENFKGKNNQTDFPHRRVQYIKSLENLLLPAQNKANSLCSITVKKIKALKLEGLRLLLCSRSGV